MFRWNKNSIAAFIDSHIVDYPTPLNLNYFWSFGSLAGFCLVIQILTGVFLGMHYTPHVDLAFDSVEHIMRDVNYGWSIRYLHANGASMFFIVVYLHIFRGLYYGSYMAPRGFLWASGVIIFLLMMATAFMGYVLPWGQMSFWGATVITNLFSAVPLVGSSIVEWLWGGFSVDNATLNRFYSLHYLLPFLIAGLTLSHLTLLHKHGSNNPLGINFNIETIPFFPYFYVKDLFAFMIMLFSLSFLVIYYPNSLGHPDNYIPANSLVTPAHIVPEWYFLPFYAILRSIPDKLGGVVAMISAILIWLLLPFFNTSLIRSSNFRPVYSFFFWFLFADFLLLGWIGQKPVETPYIEVGMLATFYYFFFFLILIPLIGIFEKFLFILKMEWFFYCKNFNNFFKFIKLQKADMFSTVLAVSSHFISDFTHPISNWPSPKDTELLKHFENELRPTYMGSRRASELLTKKYIGYYDDFFEKDAYDIKPNLFNFRLLKK